MEKLHLLRTKQKAESLLHFRQDRKIKEEFEKIVPQLEGKTVLIIMDGNRRFAQAQGWEKNAGHKAGAQVGKDMARFLLSHKINVVLWGFSTDNWQRDPEEIENIFQLAALTLDESTPEMHERNIRIKHLGDKKGLPGYLLESIEKAEKTTAENTGPFFQMALNYSGRDEMNRCFLKVAEQLHEGEIMISHGRIIDRVTESSQGRTFMDLAKELSDDEGKAFEIDLVIRPGGETRLSAFGVRADYSEQAFLPKTFPELTRTDLMKILIDFSKKDRRFGGDSKK